MVAHKKELLSDEIYAVELKAQGPSAVSNALQARFNISKEPVVAVCAGSDSADADVGK